MRYRDVVWAIVLLLFAAGPLLGQAEQPAAPPSAAELRARDVTAALARFTFTARRAIPASDNIFVEDGKVIEALFALARQENGVALPAGQSATVSKVVFLDKALHVFLAHDKFAVLILTKDNKSVADLSVDQLVDLAKKGLAALFTVKDAAKPVT